MSPLNASGPDPLRSVRSLRPAAALVLAVVALAAVVASAAAEPPTPARSYDESFAPLTLRVGRAAPDALVAGSPAPSPVAPADLVDPGDVPVPTLGPRSQPAAKVEVVVKPTPTPKPVRVATSGGSGGGRATSTGHSLRGLASWYCNNDGSRGPISACHYQYPDTGGFNAYAAAGPKLRAALGGGDRWRGRIVSVNGVAVKLVDWCQCYQGRSYEKLIDLYYDVYRRTGGNVTIRW